MARSTFLTLASLTAFLIGLIAGLMPEFLLIHLKFAQVNPEGIVMARTVGAVLISLGVLFFLVRNQPDSATLRSILIGGIILQIIILPIDPIAYLNGTYKSVVSFIPNTILHLVLLFGFSYFAINMRVSNGKSDTI